MKFGFGSLVICHLVAGIFCIPPESRKDRELSDHEHFANTDQHDTRFDHDAFLGKEDAKEFDKMTPEESKQKLSALLDKVDADQDGKVSEDELYRWIKNQNTRWQMDDTNRFWLQLEVKDEDKITFDHYIMYIYGEEKDREHDPEQLALMRKMVIRDRRRWGPADVDGDGLLNKEEFTVFLHPDDYDHMLETIITETIEDIDKNGDGYIDVEEYINDMWNPSRGGEPPAWLAHQRDQFPIVRDTNKDGHMDRDEVMKWMRPENYNPILAETKHLIYHADVDKDNMLTKEEILNKHDLFAGSQVTNYGEALQHAEL